MTRTKRINILILMIATILCIGVFAFVIRISDMVIACSYAGESSKGFHEESIGYLAAYEDRNGYSEEEAVLSQEGRLNERGRLTQRVTIYDEEGTLPITGTVTKIQDAFYPGTYEVRFSKNATLKKTATVTVKIDVPAGKTVYILTGNKQDGYTEVAQAVADEGKRVSFETSELVNFTISETDIIGAQEALLSVKARVN